MNKLTTRIITLTLAAAFLALGQTSTQSPAQKLEEALKPAKGTLEYDAGKVKTANEEMEAKQGAVRLLMASIKKGHQPPYAADMAVLARLLEQFAQKGAEYSNSFATFESHSVVFFQKIEDVFIQSNLPSNSPEKAQLTKAYQEASAWRKTLENLMPQRDPKKDMEFMDEVMAYVKPK